MASQQTGFRADKELLNRFRSQLAREGRTMSPVIEGFIEAYVSGGSPQELSQERMNEVLETVSDIMQILKAGGQPAELLKQHIRMLKRMADLEEASKTRSKGK